MSDEFGPVTEEELDAARVEIPKDARDAEIARLRSDLEIAKTSFDREEKRLSRINLDLSRDLAEEIERLRNLRDAQQDQINTQVDALNEARRQLTEAHMEIERRRGPTLDEVEAFVEELMEDGIWFDGGCLTQEAGSIMLRFVERYSSRAR